MAVSYSRIAGLALDADLALMLRRGAYRLASVLERRAHGLVKLLRLAIVLKHETTQACVLMLKHDSKVCVSKNITTIVFGRECEVHV